MEVDEYGEGFPGTLCYSNRVNEISMTAFLNICKDIIGSFDRVILMIDDTEVYYNAMRCVMGPVANRLVSERHFDQEWRKNLSIIKGGISLKAEVYKTHGN